MGIFFNFRCEVVVTMMSTGCVSRVSAAVEWLP